MKKYGLFLSILLLPLLPAVSHGMVEVTCFEPHRYYQCAVYTNTFPGVPGQGRLTIQSVHGDDLLEDARITLNRKRILASDDFDDDASYLELIVSLDETNSITVDLGKDCDDDDDDDGEGDDEGDDDNNDDGNGDDEGDDDDDDDSAGYLIIQVTQEIDADAATVIGPPGGTLQTPDGYSMIVPPNAVDEPILFSLRKLTAQSLPELLPVEIEFVGGLEIQPGGIVFNKPATITIPINIALPPDIPFPIFLFDSVNRVYEFETQGIIGEDGNSISAEINHSSVRGIFHYLFDEGEIDEEEQRILKEQILTLISEFLEKYKGKCFLDNEFLNLGNINLVSDRLFDEDLRVFIDEDYLNWKGSLAEYVNWSLLHIKVNKNWPLIHIMKTTFYDRDIVIPELSGVGPTELGDFRRTLYHEMMHAIFDDGHYDELEEKGVPNDEAITYYLENVDRTIDTLLVAVDKELRSAECRPDIVEKNLGKFVNTALDFLENPWDGEEPLPSVPYNKDPGVSERSPALSLVKALTGFDVDPIEIRDRYENGECGICGEPPPQPNPTIVGSVDTSGYAFNLYVSGSYAFIADYDGGLVTIDVSDPYNPFIVSSIDTPGYATDVHVSGSYAYLIDRPGKLYVIDISSPYNPKVISSLDIYSYRGVFGIYVSGSYAYVSGDGLKVVDISDPYNPSIISSLETRRYSRRAYVSGSYAFLAEGQFGLSVIDVSDPYNPFIVSSIDTPDYANDVYIADSYAFIADYAFAELDGGLATIDVSDPYNPFIVSSIGTQDLALGISVSNSYAFLANHYKGLFLIDISNPNSPTIVSTVDTPDAAYGVHALSSFIYVADGGSGLQVIRLFN